MNMRDNANHRDCDLHLGTDIIFHQCVSFRVGGRSVEEEGDGFKLFLVCLLRSGAAGCSGTVRGVGDWAFFFLALKVFEDIGRALGLG